MEENYEDAIPCFDRAIKANNKYTEAYLGKGLAYKALKQQQKAKKAFKRVLELSPGHLLAKENLQELQS